MVTFIIFSIIFYISNVVNLIPTFTRPPVNSQPVNTGSIAPYLQNYKQCFNVQKLLGKLINSSNSILCFKFIWFNKICGSISFGQPFIPSMSILLVHHDLLMKFQLDSMVGRPHQNDLSSNSNEVIYLSERLKDNNTFREYIQMGYIPSLSSLIYNSTLNEQIDENTPFTFNINYTGPLDYQLSKYDNCEYFITINLNTNNNEMHDLISNRYKFNCVSVFEISSSMNDIYYGTNKTKKLTANECIYELFNLLNEYDKFCLIIFNDTFNIQIPLDDQNIQHPRLLQKFTLLFVLYQAHHVIKHSTFIYAILRRTYHRFIFLHYCEQILIQTIAINLTILRLQIDLLLCYNIGQIIIE